MKRFLIGLVAFTSSVNAFAFDFSAADSAYELRENNTQKIHESRGLYAAAINGGSAAEVTYAIEQMSKLDLYETAISTDNEIIKNVSLACYENTTKLQTLTVTPSAAYYYWRAACLAVWGRANGVIASLTRSGELTELIENGNKVDSTYEGGGFYRLGSAVYAKLPSINPFGPRGDANKALDYANRAIQSAAYEGAIDPATATGDYFYNVYQFKAEALAKLGQKDAAKAVLNEAIARFDGGDLPVGREAETRAYAADLKKALADIQ